MLDFSAQRQPAFARSGVSRSVIPSYCFDWVGISAELWVRAKRQSLEKFERQ
jgi:hypothetical protein